MRRRHLLATGIAAAILGISGQVRADAPERVRDLIYTKHDGVALTLDVFKPAKPSGICVLWMVSGGWVSSHDAIDANLARAFTDRGITFVPVVHGTQPRFKLTEIVQDIHRAVRYVRANAAKYGIDPERIGISGGSAGGHLSLMMGAYGREGAADAKDPIDRASSRVQAVACFYPPTDFLNYGREGLTAYEIPPLKVFWPAFGINESTSVEEKQRLGRTTSPIYGDLTKMPPTFIIHGDADLLVPIQQSQRFIDRLVGEKVEAKLDVRPGKAHGWPGIEKDATLLIDWFLKHLDRK
jgi:acetyl esterase/lipase